MAKKKPVAKKATSTAKKKITSTKKPAAKKSSIAKKKPAISAKKPLAASRRPTTAKISTKLKGLDTTQRFLTAKPSTRRPPNNPDMPWQGIDQLNEMLIEMRTTLDDYSQHLRALDRKRLNGVGIRKLGFIERAFEFASENQDFLPHYLTLERFDNDIQYFLAFRSLFDVTRQIQEKLWNIVIQSADIAYTDALEFYASVREAAKRRVDPAESIASVLKTFFPRAKGKEEEPTEKQLKRDFDSLLKSRKDGKLVIENIKPKLTGGKHKVIDETFKDKAAFKDTEEGEIIE